MLDDLFIGLIAILGNFLKDNVAFHPIGISAQRWFEDEIKQKFQGFACTFWWNEHMEMHVIETCGCIATATKGFDPSIEISSPKLPASLEHHVFQEMGQTLLTLVFEGTAGTTPEIKASQPRIRHGGEDAPTSVSKRLVRQFWTVGWVAQDPVAKSHSVLNRTRAVASLLVNIP